MPELGSDELIDRPTDLEGKEDWSKTGEGERSTKEIRFDPHSPSRRGSSLFSHVSLTFGFYAFAVFILP